MVRLNIAMQQENENVDQHLEIFREIRFAWQIAKFMSPKYARGVFHFREMKYPRKRVKIR